MNCAIASKLSKNFSDIPINYQSAETADIYGFEPSSCALNANIILIIFEELQGFKSRPVCFGIAKVNPFLKPPNFLKLFFEIFFF